MTRCADWSENMDWAAAGVATYSNGDVYEGQFRDGRRQGQGTMEYATGEVSDGEWQDGALVTSDAAPATE